MAEMNHHAPLGTTPSDTQDKNMSCTNFHHTLKITITEQVEWKMPFLLVINLYCPNSSTNIIDHQIKKIREEPQKSRNLGLI